MLFPVGHYVGVDADADAQRHLVRVGWHLLRLDDERFAVWTLAHGLPGDDPAPWNRAGVDAVARTAGLHATGPILDDLLAEDLVIDVMPGTAEAIDFARTCRLRSQLIGLGADPDRPGAYAIGPAAGVPVVRVDAVGYEQWQWGHLCDSLWHACAVLAEASDDLPDVDAALTRSLAVLQTLIAHGAIHLDEAREDWATSDTPAAAGVVHA
jgi:hypothetical protein